MKRRESASLEDAFLKIGALPCAFLSALKSTSNVTLPRQSGLVQQFLIAGSPHRVDGGGAGGGT